MHRSSVSSRSLETSTSAVWSSHSTKALLSGYSISRAPRADVSTYTIAPGVTGCPHAARRESPRDSPRRFSERFPTPPILPDAVPGGRFATRVRARRHSWHTSVALVLQDAVALLNSPPRANRRWRPAAIPSGFAHRRAAPVHNAWASIVGSAGTAGPTVSSTAPWRRTSPQIGLHEGRFGF